MKHLKLIVAAMLLLHVCTLRLDGCFCLVGIRVYREAEHAAGRIFRGFGIAIPAVCEDSPRAHDVEYSGCCGCVIAHRAGDER